jgi:phenylacetate-CoA ligase
MGRAATRDIVPLEEGLYNLAKKQINEDAAFLKKLGIEAVECVDKALLDQYRDFKFVCIIRYVYENSRFYKRLYDAAGINIDEIRTIGDITKLPFTTPEDLALANSPDMFCIDEDKAQKTAQIGKCQYDFLCTSQAKVERAITFATSGTVGPKKRIFFSDKDIEIMTDFMAVGMNTIMDENGVTQIFLPPGPSLGQADLLSRGVKKMRGRFVVTGMLADSRTQIETIIKNGSTVLFGETRLMYRITKEMEREYDLASLGIKTIFVTTSYLCDTMRDYLEKTWNARVTTHYGLVEMGLGVAVECGRGCGYHYDELDVIAEVVDPETGKPREDGQIGEMVFTSISREVMPIIRFKNKDLSFMNKHNDQCDGLEVIGPIHTRIEAMVTLGGGMIYPTYFDNVLFTIPELIDYEIHLYNDDEKDHMTVLIETLCDGQNITDAVLDRVSADPLVQGMPIRVEYVPKDTMKSETHFKKVIGDHRQK